MKIHTLITIGLCFQLVVSFGQSASRTIKIEKPYLNLPVQLSEDRQEMNFMMEGKKERYFVIRLGDGQPDYWVFHDVTPYLGKSITITYPEKVAGFDKIYQSDKWAGQDSVYQESKRPQFHFSSKRGWNNDPNGLVYYEGEYHLFYQHNPYEHEWQNMHWGHAVSKDLIHWEEIGEALYPDELGTMFSGTATIDINNTAGFQTGATPPIIAAYTAHKSLKEGGARQTQNIAYSNDKGRTFVKYEGNPVIDSKDTWDSSNTRDPKVFWHEPSGKWVMVLFEKDGHSFYNSDNLKDWTYLSHLIGFWECPELFELPIDGNRYNTKWVIYGASGTYMLGDFDGREFTPTSGRLSYVSGQLYAAQTYNNIPEADGRRIQFGWGRGLDHGGKMPFGQLMLFPTELTLRSTRNGVRLFNEPIREVDQLHKKSHNWSQLDRAEANEKLKAVGGDLFHIKMKVRILDGTQFQLRYNGNTIVRYDMNFNKLNGAFYESDKTDTGSIELEILVDRTSVELFADDGAFTVVQELEDGVNDRGLEFAPDRGKIHIEHLTVHELKSIW